MRKFQYYGLAAVALCALSAPALAQGDATKGKAAYSKCAICHQVGPGAKTLVGPELNGIIGRKAASVADYAMYSAGMKKLAEENFVWNEQNLDKWIADPKAMLPELADGAGLSGYPGGRRTGRHHRLSEDRSRAISPSIQGEALVSAEASRSAEIFGASEAYRTENAPTAGEQGPKLSAEFHGRGLPDIGKMQSVRVAVSPTNSLEEG